MNRGAAEQEPEAGKVAVGELVATGWQTFRGHSRRFVHLIRTDNILQLSGFYLEPSKEIHHKTGALLKENKPNVIPVLVKPVDPLPGYRAIPPTPEELDNRFYKPLNPQTLFTFVVNEAIRGKTSPSRPA